MRRALRHLLIALALAVHAAGRAVARAVASRARSQGSPRAAAKARRRSAIRPSNALRFMRSTAHCRSSRFRSSRRASCCRPSRASRCLCSTRRGSCSIRARLPHSPSCFSTEPRFARRGCQRPPAEAARQRSPWRSDMFRVNATALAVAAALGIPQAAHAATEDDLKELREQVRQLKEVYEKRIESLEKRLQQTEQSAGKAEAAASKAETTANQAAVQASSRPVERERHEPRDFAGPERDLLESVPGSDRIQDQRLRPHLGRGRAAGAGLEPGRVGAGVLRQHRPLLSRRADRGARTRRQDRRRGGLYPDHRAVERLHHQGRALLLRHRLPEPDPRARLGFRRRTARQQGVSRQPAQRGRHPVQMGGADAALLRSGTGVGARAEVSRRPGRRAQARTASARATYSRIWAETSGRAPRGRSDFHI